MEEIMIEKLEFIHENKNALVDNIGVVCFYLFTILNSTKELDKIEEYSSLIEYINKKNKYETYNDSKDEKYILYFILNFLDKISMDNNEKQKYKKNISKYFDYLITNNYEKTLKIKKLAKQAI